MQALGRPFDTFLSFWNALPRSCHPLLPAKKDITPAACGTLLPYIGIGHLEKPDLMRVLFYGSALERASRVSPTGMNFYDTIPNSSRATIMEFHHTIFRKPCGAHVVYLVTGRDKEIHTFGTLHMPVTDTDGNPVYLMVFGTGLKQEHDYQGRTFTGMDETNVKEMRYINLGAGAPAMRIENHTFYGTQHDSPRRRKQHP